MKIAITGGTGFLGRNVARALVQEGHEVVLIARGKDHTDASIVDLPRTIFVRSDLGNVADLQRAFAGATAVVHCAGINREIGRQTYRSVHVDGTRSVVEAAKIAGVKKIVLISFLRARPDCGSGYHESKWEAEEIVRASGLDYTVLKCGVIYGKGDHMLDHLSHAFHTFPVFGFVGFHDQPIRPNAVQDVARIICAATVGGRLAHQTLAVVGPETLTLRQAVRRVAGVVGKHPLMIPLPLWFHYALGWLVERIMQTPLVSTAQVQMLAEGLAEPAPKCDSVPADLAPRIPFDEKQIRAGLPKPGPFTTRDIRCCQRHKEQRHFDNVFFTMP